MFQFINCKLQHLWSYAHTDERLSNHTSSAIVLIILVLTPGHRNIPFPTLFQCRETWHPSPPETCEAVQKLIISSSLSVSEYVCVYKLPLLSVKQQVISSLWVFPPVSLEHGPSLNKSHQVPQRDERLCLNALDPVVSVQYIDSLLHRKTMETTKTALISAPLF